MPQIAPVAPLSARNLHAIVRGAVVELTWGLPRVNREIRHWRAAAEAIPDPTLRADAAASFGIKHDYLVGAGFFATLPDGRSDDLLTLLVAYQAMANFLDLASERAAAHRGSAGDGSLMCALVEALDVDAPLTDYYADHPWRGDGGYLHALVRACRETSARLPRYEEARSLLLAEAGRGIALDLVHDPNALRRDAALKALVDPLPCRETSWFESAVSASSLFSVLLLIALAGDRRTTARDLALGRELYQQRVGVLGTMLDSYVDRDMDLADGAFRAIDLYPDLDSALERIEILIDQSLRGAGRLRHGDRHVLLVAMMIALYLSADGARKATTLRFARSGGAMTIALVPVLRAWRHINHHMA